MTRRALRLTVLAVALIATTVVVATWDANINPKAWTKSGSGVFGKAESGELTVALPSWPSTIYYAWTTPAGSLAGTMTVSLRMVTTGTPLFVWDTEGNPCAVPATVRPFFGRYSQRRRKIENADRWWPTGASYPLGPGEAVLSVPLERSYFTGVQFTGLPDDQAFQLAADDPDLIGFSFGGGCFYGHGVGVQGGSALLLVSQFMVQ